MNYPIRPHAGEGPSTSLATVPAAASPKRHISRRYEVSYLAPSGQIEDANFIAPAVPVFEEAFSAFARGTMIATEDGPIAIEDLTPGQMITTFEGPKPLLWRGSLTVIPNQPCTSSLTRLASDCFGPSRPMGDLMLGPSARFLCRKPEATLPLSFRNAEDSVDGETAMEIRPVAAVPLYHLVLEQQELIYVNGLEAASYHPVLGAERALTGEALTVFLKFFPFLRRLEDFGMPLQSRAIPRNVA